MSFKNGVSLDNSNFKFLELKKYLIPSSDATNSGLQWLTVDNNQQQVLAIGGSHLYVIPLPQLLAFEWNRSVVNSIDEQLPPHVSLPLNFTPHLLSLSGAAGFGQKLAVCGADQQTGNPFVIFYDLNDIYRHQSKCGPFNRINLANSTGTVTDIVWHPELSDNLFVCCVNDGSLFIVSIGDSSANKTAAILGDVKPNPNGAHPLSMCWSPKGKQLVVGHRNGFFSQYKLNVTAGQPVLQEVKRTQLTVNGFQEHQVIAIKWIVSSMFAIAITKDASNGEKDTHFLLVSTPTKAPPVFVDYGAVCYDNSDVQDLYRIILMQYENMILCSTSMTSEVVIIGCETGKDQAMLDNWNQWILDDSSRIDMPMDSAGNDTYLRGLAVSRGTQNVYKLSASEAYGGVDCPVLLVYNSAGILVPYLMIDKTGQLKCPAPPGGVVKPSAPIVSPVPAPPKQLTSTPIISADNGRQMQPKASAPSFGNIAVTPKPHSATNVANTSTPAQVVSKSTAKQSNVNPNSASVGQPQPSVARSASSSPASSEDTTAATNELYLTAIRERIVEFKQLMAETKQKYSQIKVNIGDKEEQQKLRADTRLIDDVLKEIRENLRLTSKDTSCLQSSLIESFSLLEETKSIMNRNVDPNYRQLLKHRALDPITARRMQDIQSLNEYIETQLRELDSKFEQEWYEWLERRKAALKGKSPARLSQKNNSLELIYKALANNSRAISVFRAQVDALDGLTGSLSPSRLTPKGRLIKDPASAETANQKLMDKLSQTMDKTSIKDIPAVEDIPIDRMFKLKSISNEKRNNLRQFFEYRTKVPVRRPVDNSARFMSAIKRIKDRQKTLQSATPVKSGTTVGASTTLATRMTSMDNKVVITPTVVTKSPEKSSVKLAESTQPFGANIGKPFASTSTPLSFSLNTKAVPSLTPSLSGVSQKTTPTATTSAFSKPTDQFPSFASKPLTFNLNASPIGGAIGSTGAPKPSPLAASTPTKAVPPQTLTVKSQKISVAEAVSKRLEPVVSTGSTSPNTAKSVSFGNTTIINPINTTVDEDDSDNNRDYKLDTINELSETGDSVSSSPAFTSNSPFTAFKGFGSDGGANDSATDQSFPPKLSFNLNQSNSSFSFNVSTDSRKDPLPKYEDISPPNTPLRTVSTVPISSTASEPDSTSKPTSILKALISGNTGDDKENKTTQPTVQSPFSANVHKSISVTSPSPPVTTTTTAASPATTKTSLLAQLITAPATPSTAPTTAPSFMAASTISTVAPNASPFGANQSNISTAQTPAFGQTASTGFGQTPFASSSFSFGNTAPPAAASTTSPPAFGQQTGTGQTPSFGGTATGFGSPTNQTPTTGTGGFSFNQQSAALNNMSFCGLGGRPTAESASKNAFGGAFSSPALSSQPSTTPFGGGFKSSTSPTPAFGGGGSGSFTSGTAGVAQTGFAAFQSPQQQPSTQSVFGGAPVFGATQQSTFGGSPTFGGPPQVSGFGSAPAFGGAPAFGSMANTAAGPAFGTQSAFGGNSGFANSVNSDLTFGALASNAHQTSPGGQQTATPFGGGFSGFGATSDQFMQRRK